MMKTREDNTITVIQRAVKEYGIRVTRGSVKLALKSHPDYPTFKSICDVFNEWNIEHYPLKYKPEELPDIAVPYIAHLNVGGGRLEPNARPRHRLGAWSRKLSAQRLGCNCYLEVHTATLHCGW